jgi:hypothetical protein
VSIIADHIWGTLGVEISRVTQLARIPLQLVTNFRGGKFKIDDMSLYKKKIFTLSQMQTSPE